MITPIQFIEIIFKNERCTLIEPELGQYLGHTRSILLLIINTQRHVPEVRLFGRGH